MERNKRTPLIILILLLVVGVTTGYVASTYAKYTSNLGTKEGTATVAKWAFGTSEGNAFNIDLTGTYNPNTLVAGKIAPGTEGSFNIELDNSGSDVGVDYVLTIGNAANKPTNLKFYTDSGHHNEITNNTISGRLAPKATATEVTIYWAWEYEIGTGETLTANDAADTANGEAAADMTVPVTITGTQVTPEKTTP